jgi:NAD+ kinase
LIIVLGGDGTILSAVHALGASLRPIFGINLGTLGFLTCLSSADYLQAVRCIVHGDFLLSQRTLLHVELVRAGAVIETHSGLNDAVISRGALSRLIRLETRLNGTLLTEYNADGLIVATPTGSTAYSLSAGGPLLTPESNVFAITPICPHTLTNRSVIISDQTSVEVRISDARDEIYLTVDGQRAVPMHSCDSVRIRRSGETLPLAMLPDLPFFELARRKLKWSGSSL